MSVHNYFCLLQDPQTFYLKLQIKVRVEQSIFNFCSDLTIDCLHESLFHSPQTSAYSLLSLRDPQDLVGGHRHYCLPRLGSQSVYFFSQG